MPGVVASIQTFDGAYRKDGTFVPLSFHDPAVLSEAFRRAVLAAFVRRGLLSPEAADAMMAWPHSGFHVHHHVRIDAHDVTGRAHVARYAARTPVALSRITYDPESSGRSAEWRGGSSLVGRGGRRAPGQAPGRTGEPSGSRLLGSDFLFLFLLSLMWPKHSRPAAARSAPGTCTARGSARRAR